MAQLPLYSSGGKLQYGGRRSFSFRDRHLLLIILAVFAIICLGSLYYAPEVIEQVSFDVTYRKFIGLQDEANVVVSDNAVMDDQVAPSKVPSANQQKMADETHNDPDETHGNPDETVKVIDDHDHADTGGVQEDVDVRRNVEEEKKQDVPARSEHQKEESVEQPADNEHFVNIENRNTDPVVTQRREKVKEMMLHAWNNYAKFAWGQNELRPISQRGHSAGIFGQSAVGATIIDAADTLYIMGLHEEYKKARDWIAQSFSFDSVSSEVSVFEINIRFVGGLLSLYALTKDEVFKTKAVHVADKLLPAFNTPTGIPNAIINLRTGGSHNWGWASGGCSILAEFGTLHLEFQYLTYITGNPVYMQKVKRIREVLRQVDKPDGLYANYLNPRSGTWGSRHVSLGALGDSFYEYLLKSWVGTSKKDVEAKDMYFNTIRAIENTMIKKSPSGLVYVGNYRSGRVEPRMEHLACFSGGMFALASMHISDQAQKEHDLKVGADLTNTCHESYIRTDTHIGPESFSFPSESNDAKALTGGNRVYIMRPETVESYFVLWRATHDNKYREWAWDAIQAIDKHCRVDNGFSGLRDVYNANSNSPKDDVQQSFFLAETLKYLYLIFCDDSVVSLDKWVFNTEAHPLPILPDVPHVDKR